MRNPYLFIIAVFLALTPFNAFTQGNECSCPNWVKSDNRSIEEFLGLPGAYSVVCANLRVNSKMGVFVVPLRSSADFEKKVDEMKKVIQVDSTTAPYKIWVADICVKRDDKVMKYAPKVVEERK